MAGSLYKEILKNAYDTYADDKRPTTALTQEQKKFFIWFLWGKVGGDRPFDSLSEISKFGGLVSGGDYEKGKKVLNNFLNHEGKTELRVGTSGEDVQRLFGNPVGEGDKIFIWYKINDKIGNTWNTLTSKQKTFLILEYYLLKYYYGDKMSLKDIYIKNRENPRITRMVDGVREDQQTTFAKEINRLFFGLSEDLLSDNIYGVVKAASYSLSEEIPESTGGATGTGALTVAGGGWVESIDKEDLANLNVFDFDIPEDMQKKIKDFLDKQRDRDYTAVDSDEALIRGLKYSQKVAEDGIGRLTTKEIDEELKEEGGLGDGLEQCILLTKLADFADYRRSVRSLILPSEEAYKAMPYGGRVIPVKCEKVESFVNLCSSPYSIYDYSKELTTDIHSKIEYGFEIVKIYEKQGGDIEEYPLLFGGQRDKTGKTPRTVELNITTRHQPEIKRGKDGTITKEEQKNLTSTIGHGTDVDIMNETVLTNLSIKYKGENLATARTNVDVELKIDIPHLLIFQAVFEASRDSNPENNYKYSVLDLITYLNNSEISDGNKQNGSKYYSPLYKVRYNRLAMKILPRATTKTALEGEEYKNIKRYVDNSSLYLDLALVDYTINKDEVLNKASITINYKGYVRSHLNDAMTDCLNTSEEMNGEDGLIKEEEKFIETLDKLKCVKNIRQKITERNKLSMSEDKKELREANRVASRQRIFEGLIDREKLFFFSYDVTKILGGNVDRESKKIIDPGQVHKNILEAGVLKESIKNFSSLSSELIDDDIVMNNSNEKLSFFYLGDLIDVLMNVMYEEYNPQGTRDIEKTSENFTNFPLKVILPTFKAVTLDDSKGTFTKEKEISLADVPIASAYFSKWFQKEVIDMDVIHYPLGTMINKIINTLLNNVLNDNCYLDGNPERKYFSVKSDFGKFDDKENNITTFDMLMKLGLLGEFNTRDDSTASAYLAKENAPFFRKDFTAKRTEHCNYLVVYEQISAFSDYSHIDLSKKNYQSEFKKYAIPEFKIRDNKKVIIEKGGKKFKTNIGTSLTQKIAFKKTDIPYQRETRYFADNLNSLSQLASVHNVTITTKPLLTMFPGMLIWVDAGLMDPPQTVNSIAWLLGMGGFHVTTEVTHKAEISIGKLKRAKFTTVIEGVYVNNGADSHDNGNCTTDGAAEEAAKNGTEKQE